MREELRMIPLDELEREAAELQLRIRRLVLNNFSFDDGIADQLTKIATITALRSRFVAVEKEIRMRISEH